MSGPIRTPAEALEAVRRLLVERAPSFGLSSHDAMQIGMQIGRSLVERIEPEWRPIETAPKDGTEILVCGGTIENSASLAGSEPLTRAVIAYWQDGFFPFWCAGNGDGSEEHFIAEPTHWRPLPAPPKEPENG